MIAISPTYLAGQRDSTVAELIVFELINSFGVYAFSDIDPSDEMLGMSGVVYADGSHLADGSFTAGGDSIGLLGSGARVKSFGAIREAANSDPRDLLSAFKKTETPSFTIVLDNADNYFGQIAAGQNLLGAKGKVRVGYPDVIAREYLPRFSGTVQSYELTRQALTLQLRAV